MAKSGAAVTRVGGGFLVKMAGRLFRRAGRRAGGGPGRGSTRYLPWSGSGRHVGAPQSKWAEEAYERISRTTGDTRRIADNTGIDKGVLDRIKRHIFQTEHRGVAVGPNQFADGRFAPMDHIADLWQKAEKGTLSPDEAVQFRRWAAHEGVESRLMEQGMPYRSGHPSAWDDGLGWPTAQHHGAHDLAPNEGSRGPFSHYPNMLGRDEPDIEIADDLSNIDDVVRTITGGGR